jgi:hypothetical protein
LLLNFLLLLEFVEKLWPILNRVFSNQYLLFFAVSVSKKNILILKPFHSFYSTFGPFLFIYAQQHFSPFSFL